MPSTRISVSAARAPSRRMRFARSCRIVVAKADDLRAAQAATVVDAGVAIGIEQHDVIRPGEPRQHAEIRLVTRGEHDGVAHAVERREFLLKPPVARIAAVRHARAGRAGTLGVEGPVRRRDALGIEGQAEVVIGAGKNGVPSVDDPLGRRDDAFDLHAEWIDAERFEFAPGRRHALKLVE